MRILCAKNECCELIECFALINNFLRIVGSDSRLRVPDTSVTSDGHVSTVSAEVPVTGFRATKLVESYKLAKPSQKLPTTTMAYTRSQRRYANTRPYVSVFAKGSPRRLATANVSQAKQAQKTQQPRTTLRFTGDSGASDSSMTLRSASKKKKKRMTVEDSETDISDTSAMSILCPASEFWFALLVLRQLILMQSTLFLS